MGSLFLNCGGPSHPFLVQFRLHLPRVSDIGGGPRREKLPIHQLGPLGFAAWRLSWSVPFECPPPPTRKRKRSHIFCLALRLRREVLGVCALRLIVNFVTLAVPGVAFFDDIHLRMEWMELGVSHSVCAGDSPTFHTPSTVVLLRFTGVSWKRTWG